MSQKANIQCSKERNKCTDFTLTSQSHYIPFYYRMKKNKIHIILCIIFFIEKYISHLLKFNEIWGSFFCARKMKFTYLWKFWSGFSYLLCSQCWEKLTHRPDGINEKKNNKIKHKQQKRSWKERKTDIEVLISSFVCVNSKS